MIRFVIGLFIFAVALCAYIVSTQHGGILPQTATVDIVEPEAAAPVDIAPPIENDDTTAQILDSIVARELGYATTPVPVGVAVNDTLRVLGLDVPNPSDATADRRFAAIVGTALKAGTKDPEIIAIIDAAARSGDLSVPESLVRADRQIDTATYLKAVVTTAVLVSEDTTPVAPDLSNDPAAIITADGYDYIITEADSLAAIAVKFYGDVTQTSRIAQANPMALARPDQITAGTTITIPTF